MTTTHPDEGCAVCDEHAAEVCAEHGDAPAGLFVRTGPHGFFWAPPDAPSPLVGDLIEGLPGEGWRDVGFTTEDGAPRTCAPASEHGSIVYSEDESWHFRAPTSVTIAAQFSPRLMGIAVGLTRAELRWVLGAGPHPMAHVHPAYDRRRRARRRRARR